MTRSSWEDEKKLIEGGFRWECSQCSHTGNVLHVAVSALTIVSDVYIYDVRHQAAAVVRPHTRPLLVTVVNIIRCVTRSRLCTGPRLPLVSPGH